MREVDRFKADLTDPMVRADHAFNVVITAWHLCDWVFANLTSAQRAKLCINSRQDMQAIARKCRALHLCEQAATASKHWAVFDKYRDPKVSTIVAIAPFNPSDDIGAPPKFDVLFKDGDQYIPAEKVFDDAINFWTQFIYVEYQIAANEVS